MCSLGILLNFLVVFFKSLDNVLRILDLFGISDCVELDRSKIVEFLEWFAFLVVWVIWISKLRKSFFYRSTIGISLNLEKEVIKLLDKSFINL